MLRQDVEVYVRDCDVYLTSKVVCHKLYKDLESLPISTHCWKALSIDFVISLLLLVDRKGDSYDRIFIIVNRLIKMVYYKVV